MWPRGVSRFPWHCRPGHTVGCVDLDCLQDGGNWRGGGGVGVGVQLPLIEEEGVDEAED